MIFSFSRLTLAMALLLTTVASVAQTARRTESAASPKKLVRYPGEGNDPFLS